MATKMFECAACGEGFENEMSAVECRVCHRLYCDECVNEDGICVPCE